MSKKQRSISYVVFAIYMVLLTWLILLKFSVNLEEVIQVNMRNINMIPFKESVIVNGKLRLSEIIYNVLVFIPLGVYILIFKPEWTIYKKIFSVLMLSFVYETAQYVFAIGASDITDIISNTLGGILGIGVFRVIKKLFSKKYINVINTIGISVEVLAFSLIILLTIANM